MTIPSITWLALTAEHGLGVDTQIHTLCIFMAVVATIQARVTGLANLKQVPQNLENGSL